MKKIDESLGTIYTGNLKDEKGITLIALVITIIVLLILAGVTIISLTGENGILNKSKTAKDTWNKGQEEEQIKLAVLNSKMLDEGTNFSINKEELVKQLHALGIENIEKNTIDDDDTAFPWTVTGKTGTKYIIDEKGNVEEKNGVGALEIFDKENKDENKLHIGDFVNYDAGTWTEEEINNIKVGRNDDLVTANGSTKLPTANFQFGGFVAGTSRNGNATPYGTYSYVDEKKSDGTKQAVTGWRVFDIVEDGSEKGSIELISAGCPEDYYHPQGTDNAYISEYILTENINNNATLLNLKTDYTKRNWNNYANKNQEAKSAIVLTKKMLDDWYGKYIQADAETYNEKTFQKIYKTSPNCVNNGMYESLIDNYSCYWLSLARNSSYMYYMGPTYQNSNGLRACD